MADSIRRRELASVDLSDVVTGARIGPVPPGDVLRADFMEPVRLSARALAREMNMPTNRVTEIINGQRAITADTAVMLGLRFGTGDDFWLRLQNAHDLEMARERRLDALENQLRMLRTGSVHTGSNGVDDTPQTIDGLSDG